MFPAAGYIAMAIEALYQTIRSTHRSDVDAQRHELCYRFRNILLTRAMVLTEGADHKIMFNLAPFLGTNQSWHEFKISSSTGGTWNEHCKGLICLTEISPQGNHSDILYCSRTRAFNANCEVAIGTTELRPLEHGVPGRLWYKAMRDVGLIFGDGFQKLLEVESTSGSQHNRALVSLSEPSSNFPQSSYPLHPAVIDGCFQSGVPSLWQGNRSSMNTVLVPSVIDDLIINLQTTLPEIGLAIASAEDVGAGRPDLAKSYKMHTSVYDCKTGQLVFQLTGLRCNSIDTQNPHLSHKYTRITWEPDISFLLQHQLPSITTCDHKLPQGPDAQCPLEKVQRVIDSIVHKTPNLAAMEVDVVGNLQSVWLDGMSPSRLASRRYIFASATARNLIDLQDKYGASEYSEFRLLDLTTSPNLGTDERAFDLIILKLLRVSKINATKMLKNARSLLRNTGYLLLMNYSHFPADSSSNEDPPVTWDFNNSLQTEGFQNVLQIIQDGRSSDVLNSAYIAAARCQVLKSFEKDSVVDLARLSSGKETGCSLGQELSALGWRIRHHESPFDSLKQKGIVLVLDELFSPVLSHIGKEQWLGLKQLMQQGSRILWVTIGAQFRVTHPDNALFHGLVRTLRAEDPSLVLLTLDLESQANPDNASYISSMLDYLKGLQPEIHIDSDFCERDGIIYVSRVLLDIPMNQIEADDTYGPESVVQSLHGHPSCIRLRCERVGTLDSLHYTEIPDAEMRLEDTFVEVDLYAAGLNFKVIQTRFIF